jgi:hypothetical protein
MRVLRHNEKIESESNLTPLLRDGACSKSTASPACADYFPGTITSTVEIDGRKKNGTADRNVPELKQRGHLLIKIRS